MSVVDFLKQVVTAQEGYFELCIRNGTWQQHFYTYPDDLPAIASHTEAAAKQGDVYFSTYLYNARISTKEHVLPSRTIQLDLDDADIKSLPITPAIITNTSPNRHQAFVILDTLPTANQASNDYHEYLSRKLTYAIPMCDRSGWPLGRKVRLPDTYNYKYGTTNPHPVTIISTSSKRYSSDDIELLPDPPSQVTSDTDRAFVVYPPMPTGLSAYELVEQVKDLLATKVYTEYYADGPSSDRSASLWALTTQCFKAGLSRDDVYWVAKHSPNNKFSNLRFNGDAELAKDVLRAELAILDKSLNVRQLISDARKLTKLSMHERKLIMYEAILSHMRQEGEFINTTDGRRYYILREQGRPVDLDRHSEYLDSLIDVKYGLNRSEPEHGYVVNALMAYSTTVNETAQVSSLSYYDVSSKTILIHTGRKHVYAITPEGLTQCVNGDYDVIFLWDKIIEPFNPVDSEYPWATVLFGEIPNCINLTSDEAVVLLRVWFLFLLMRNAASSRPILALLGQPGSAKTTLAKKIYAMIYGRTVDLSGLTNPANFDISTATLPFFVLDNLDTWERWIPDRLAQAAGRTDILVKKLYTNNQMVRIKRQAMLGVTAHDPKFGRADVIDRMLIISLQSFRNIGIPFVDESQLMDSIMRQRNKLWGGVVHDLIQILRTPVPESTDIQLRIQDFAKFGDWIASALNIRPLFVSAIANLKSSQQLFTLDADHLLVSNMTRWLAKLGGSSGPKTQDQVYAEVLLCVATEDYVAFTRAYRDSGAFVKRLSTLQHTLSSLITIDFSMSKANERLWIITLKDDNDGDTE